jgi:hypothetical protein
MVAHLPASIIGRIGTLLTHTDRNAARLAHRCFANIHEERNYHQFDITPSNLAARPLAERVAIVMRLKPALAELLIVMKEDDTWGEATEFRLPEVPARIELRLETCGDAALVAATAALTAWPQQAPIDLFFKIEERHRAPSVESLKQLDAALKSCVAVTLEVQDEHACMYPTLTALNAPCATYKAYSQDKTKAQQITLPPRAYNIVGIRCRTSTVINPEAMDKLILCCPNAVLEPWFTIGTVSPCLKHIMLFNVACYLLFDYLQTIDDVLTLVERVPWNIEVMINDFACAPLLLKILRAHPSVNVKFCGENPDAYRIYRLLCHYSNRTYEWVGQATDLDGGPLDWYRGMEDAMRKAWYWVEFVEEVGSHVE